MATSYVRVWHANFSCSSLQTHKILKNTREELRNTRVSPARVLQVIELYCTKQVFLLRSQLLFGSDAVMYVLSLEACSMVTAMYCH